MSHSVEAIYDVYDEHRTTARKAHRCDACKEQVLPGATYFRIGILFDGIWQTVKRCVRCQAIHRHLRDRGGQDMWPDERLDCGESYEDHWGEPPPPEIEALAFALPSQLPSSKDLGTKPNGT